MARNALMTGKKLTVTLALVIILSASVILTAQSYKLYVTHPNYFKEGQGAVSILNYNNHEYISPLYTTPLADRALYVKKLNQLFVFSSDKAVCEVYDPIIDEKIREFQTGGPVADVIFSLNARRMYVANGSDSPDPKNTVTVIDVATGNQIF